jgi:hypothetical protein
MDDIAAEVRAAFAAIMDAIPPIPPEASNAFLAIGAGGVLILLVSMSEYVGKIICKRGTGSEAQSHRLMVKNRKPATKATRMIIVTMPMIAAYSHAGARRNSRSHNWQKLAALRDDAL